MAIHDVDKNSSERTAPIPNTVDSMGTLPRMAHNTNSINYTTDATDDPTGGTNTGTAGGGAVIKAGFKRLVAVCTIGVVNDGSTITTAQIDHNLGYVPIVEAVVENGSATIATGTATGVSMPLPLFTNATFDLVTPKINFQTWLYAFANSTTMYVNMANSTGTPITTTVTCYLYQKAVG